MTMRVKCSHRRVARGKDSTDLIMESRIKGSVRERTSAWATKLPPGSSDVFLQRGGGAAGATAPGAGLGTPLGKLPEEATVECERRTWERTERTS